MGRPTGARTRSRQQTRAYCWYCGGPGVSDEHVLAQTLTDLFPRGQFVHTYELPELGIAPKTKRANRLALSARRFCVRCNNEWMSKIDNAAKPALAPLAAGRSHQIDLSRQEKLATWATKTILSYLAVDHEERRWAEPEVYREFFHARRPLHRSQIWLGTHGTRYIGWQRSSSLVYPGAPDGLAGFASTLAFGRAVFFLLHHRKPRVRLTPSDDARPFLRQLWPAPEVAIRWPTAYVLDEATLHRMSVFVTRNAKLSDGHAA